MNSARWRDAAAASRQPPEAPKKPTHPINHALESKLKTLNWIQDKELYQQQISKTLPRKTRFSCPEATNGVETLGFVLDKLDLEDVAKKVELDYGKRMGFVDVGTLEAKKRGNDEVNPFEQLKQLYEMRQARDAECKGNVLAQAELIRLYMRAMRDPDSDNDEEFLDTTATMQAPDRARRGSLNSGGSSKASKSACVIS